MTRLNPFLMLVALALGGVAVGSTGTSVERAQSPAPSVEFAVRELPVADGTGADVECRARPAPETAQADPADGPDGVPPYTRRANRRYVSSAGSDGNDGLTRDTPWASLREHVRDGSLPSDTEIVVLDGEHRFSAPGEKFENPLLFSSVPDRITLRGETYRGATLRGPENHDQGPDSIALYIYGSSDDVEVYGLQFTRWQMPPAGAGVILVEAAGRERSTGFRAIGNRFHDYGEYSNTTHAIYLSASESASKGHTDWRIAYNDFEPGDDAGAVIANFGLLAEAHSGEIDHNICRTPAGQTVKVFYRHIDGRPDGTNTSIHVHDNDLQGTYTAAIFRFGAYGKRNGVDGTFLVEDNFLSNDSTSRSDYIASSDDTAASFEPNRPTFRNNVVRRPNQPDSLWFNLDLQSN